MITRAVSVSRIHTVAWPLLVAWPLGILAIAFLIPWTIFALVDANEQSYTGGMSALLGVALAFYISAMTQTFPFAVGMSVTRRDYFAGTLLVALVQTLGFGTILWLLALIERASDGWGVKMVMFDIPGQFTDNPMLQLATFLAFMSLVAGLGLLIGSVYQRWRLTGLYGMGTAVLLFFGGAAILLTWLNGWSALGSWLVDTPRFLPMVAVPVALTAAGLVGAWAALRRSTP